MTFTFTPEPVAARTGGPPFLIFFSIPLNLEGDPSLRLRSGQALCGARVGFDTSSRSSLSRYNDRPSRRVKPEGGNCELAVSASTSVTPTLCSERKKKDRALRKGWGTLILVRARDEGGRVGHPASTAFPLAFRPVASTMAAYAKSLDLRCAGLRVRRDRAAEPGGNNL